VTTYTLSPDAARVALAMAESEAAAARARVADAVLALHLDVRPYLPRKVQAACADVDAAVAHVAHARRALAEACGTTNRRTGA
jgi:hypothetical protein